MLVKRGFTDIRAFGNVEDLDAVVAALGDHIASRVQQALVGGGLALLVSGKWSGHNVFSRLQSINGRRV